MAIVNFSIPQVLDNKINQAVKEKGFASKAELFRLAVIQYLDGFFDDDKLTKEEERELKLRLAEGRKNSIKHEDMVKLFS